MVVMGGIGPRRPTASAFSFARLSYHWYDSSAIAISGKSPTMLPIQSKMARTALGWGTRDLAKHAKVSPDTVARLERGDPTVTEATVMLLRGVLERAGVEFIPENGGGAGVRLRKRARR